VSPEGCVASTPARVVVERDGRLVPLTVRPEYSERADQTLVGFGMEATDLGPVDATPAEAAGNAADQIWFITRETMGVFANIFHRADELSGPVGSYEATRQAFTFDARFALGILGLISLSLAIINLFPFLPLDGGHIFWSLVEKVRGRPVPYATMERGAAVGFMLVLMLFFIGMTNDIGRLTGEGFNLR
jgi:regulator of sigma E protease